MAKKAIYPGSFDPVTNGHLDIITRASHIFDEVIVAVAHNSTKQALFEISERVDLLKEVTKDIAGITVTSFHGLVIDFARDNNIQVLVRGLRVTSDFEYEFQMALTNRRLTSEVETVFLMPSEGHSFVSSSLLKEVASFGGDLSTFVPEPVGKALQKKL